MNKVPASPVWASGQRTRSGYRNQLFWLSEGWRVLMKAILSKSPIPVVIVIAALVAGTSLLAGHGNGPTQAPQPVAQANCDGCPLQNTPACPKIAGASADPQMHAAAAPCAGTDASATPCAGTEGCPMPCCQKADQVPTTGCTMQKPPTGCPFLEASRQTASPCGAGACTQEKK